MAPPAGNLRVGRYFAALIVLLGLLYLVVFFPDSRHTPKLGIDLVGGKRVIFTARVTNGSTPPSSAMSQARQIIEDRINGTGVTGATVQVQGDNQLVVLIPGGTDTDVAQLGQPAVLNFRPLITSAVPVTCISSTTSTAKGASASPSASGAASSPASVKPSAKAASTAATSASNSPNGAAQRPLAKATTTPAASTSAAKTSAAKTSAAKTSAAKTSAAASAAKTSGAKASGAATSTAAAASSSAAPVPCVKDPFTALMKADPTLKIPTTEAEYDKLTATQKQEIAAGLGVYDCSAALDEKDDPTNYYVACDDGKSYGEKIAYLLGQVIVKGSQIDSAAAQAPNSGSGGGTTEWTVSLNLKSSGSAAWGKWTSKYNTKGSSSGSALQCGASQAFVCSDWVGFTLNGQVISAPYTSQAINGGATQISGNFTQSSANDLAQQLNYGSLPISFTTDANEQVSATLGTQQLNAALLAGGIGLALVVLYSLLYYRGLGIVTIASLLVSAGLTYAMLVILGTQIGFTLDLAGIAGFIVALGITADSFVVFFERIKDEVHEGRSMRVAVPRAWVRARRTILSADTVSFLAAAILYFFASADVKGFAFTLGMSTILDLVVVFLFTHPIVSLLSRSRTFGSPRFTGLNSVRTGGVVDDELPERRTRKPARSRTAPSTTSTPTKSSTKGSSTAVLDKPSKKKAKTSADVDDVSDSDVLDTDVTSDDVADTDAADSDATDTDATDTDDDSRRRSTPEPGTAAERAAARRARMRARDEEGTS